ncbi:hypothetical protein ACFOW1_01625 [Parasediminibacterium paludis]|uniref:Uncharacterized protein n=1 Tax=Parasediminibacterium paludis TaxID=908966 RepID=A0ABV8PTC9_9BACT
MQSISLKEVIAWMDSGKPFSIGFVTCDKQQNKGGEWIEIPEATKYEWMTTREKASIAKAAPSTALKKNPNHYDNSTRNIKLPNLQKRKVHLRLITTFNGKTVL